MEDFTQKDLDELRRLAIQMYEMVLESMDIRVCLNPDEPDYFKDCFDCGWYKCELRDSLLRLGVNI